VGQVQRRGAHRRELGDALGAPQGGCSRCGRRPRGTASSWRS
jgi:hypothetical protein